MRNNLLWFVLVLIFVVGIVPLQEGVVWTSRNVQAATEFFVQHITTTQIQNKYGTEKIRILIVPGHRPNIGGTQFRDLYERTVVVDIADALAALLAQNPHYDVMVSRTKTAWHPTLQTYFDTHALEIETFRQSQALQMANHLANGNFILDDDQMYHLDTPSVAALQLYGINKWTSDNEYDITLHLHLNDYPRRRMNIAGVHDGFTIFVPDHQYSNAEAFRAIGEAIATRLNAYHATSTLPQESAGVVPDQQLIAVGSNNSAKVASLLIEYGYIYEPQFQNASVRKVAVADYAYKTYLGLQDFFNDPVSLTYGSISFPFDWDKVIGKKDERGPGVYALQTALHYLGHYPPLGKSFSKCPISGVSGSCTRAAIIKYQRIHGLAATGTLGPKTRAVLERDIASH